MTVVMMPWNSLLKHSRAFLLLFFPSPQLEELLLTPPVHIELTQMPFVTLEWSSTVV